MQSALAPLLLAALPLFLLASCGGDDPGDTDQGTPGGSGAGGATGGAGGAGGAPWVELGTGAEAFEPLGPGQSVPVIAGPQGGYHVWGALQAGGIDPRGVTMHFALAQGDVVVAEASAVDDLFRATPDGPLQYTRVAVQLLANDPGALAPGAALLRLDLTTSGGRALHDEVEIVPVCCQ